MKYNAMMECECGSFHFTWDSDTSEFNCIECGKFYTPDEAGHVIILTEDYNEGD